MKPIADFLDQHTAVDSKPFLLWYAPVLPHEPHDPPQQYIHRYRNDPRVPRHLVSYYATCTWFDDTVGQLVGMLDQRQLTRSTMIVLVSDNGWTPSTVENAKDSTYGVDDHSKRSPFERGLRTPILVHWDGHVKPALHEELCSSVDVVPTILSAIGQADDAAGMSGIDLMPSARGETKLDADRAVFGEVYPGDATQLGNPAADVAYRWVRRGPWKLIVPHGRPGKPAWGGYLAEPALYNVVDDREEQTNLISTAGNGPLAAQLRRILDDWWTVPENTAASIHTGRPASDDSRR